MDKLSPDGGFFHSLILFLEGVSFVSFSKRADSLCRIECIF